MTTARRADATVGRAVSVEELVRRSHGVLGATPLERMAEWARVGGTRRIVTLTRVRVEEAVAGALYVIVALMWLIPDRRIERVLASRQGE